MDQGRGLWDLLFGVADPGAGVFGQTAGDIKMEPNFNMDLSEDLMALLDPILSNGNLNPDSCSSSSGSLDLMEECMPDIDACAGLDLDALNDLSAYLQMQPDLVSSCSISSGGGSDDDAVSSSETQSIQGSPKSSHSSSSSSLDGKAAAQEELLLTREENILLKKEGLALPKSYPLTKSEERTLKKIRRKIRNKKSAQESRRKKKVYMDTLEDQVKDITDKNKVLQKRVKELEKENVSLQQQLKTLQNVFGRATRNTKATGTCLMALVLSVALIVSPYTQNQSVEEGKESIMLGNYEVENVAPVRTRIMHHLDGPPEPRLFGGIPLAKEGFRILKEDTVPAAGPVMASNSVVVDSNWDERYDRPPVQNVRLTIEKNRTTASR